MKIRTILLFALAILSAAPLRAGELDAALEAQKKKAQRRVYSEKAVMSEQQLELPKTPTEEELALDKKLEQMERERDLGTARRAAPVQQRPALRAPVEADNKNWLQPADLESREKKNLEDAAENAWLIQELDRQKSQKATAAAEAAQREQQREALQKETERLKKAYEPMRMPGAASREEPAERTGLNPLQRERSTAYGSTLSPLKTRAPEPAAQAAPQLSPFGKPAQIKMPGTEEEPESPMLSPVQRIRQSSPIHQENPFADSLTPGVKKTIWD